MARKTFYLFGKLSTDGSPTIYDSTVTHDRIRFHFCDTGDDLPTSGIGEGDVAIVKGNKRLMFVMNGEWVQIKAKDKE